MQRILYKVIHGLDGPVHSEWAEWANAAHSQAKQLAKSLAESPPKSVESVTKLRASVRKAASGIISGYIRGILCETKAIESNATETCALLKEIHQLLPSQQSDLIKELHPHFGAAFKNTCCLKSVWDDQKCHLKQLCDVLHVLAEERETLLQIRTFKVRFCNKEENEVGRFTALLDSVVDAVDKVFCRHAHYGIEHDPHTGPHSTLFSFLRHVLEHCISSANKSLSAVPHNLNHQPLTGHTDEDSLLTRCPLFSELKGRINMLWASLDKLGVLQKNVHIAADTSLKLLIQSSMHLLLVVAKITDILLHKSNTCVWNKLWNVLRVNVREGHQKVRGFLQKTSYPQHQHLLVLCILSVMQGNEALTKSHSADTHIPLFRLWIIQQRIILLLQHAFRHKFQDGAIFLRAMTIMERVQVMKTKTSEHSRTYMGGMDRLPTSCNDLEGKMMNSVLTQGKKEVIERITPEAIKRTENLCKCLQKHILDPKILTVEGKDAMALGKSRSSTLQCIESQISQILDQQMYVKEERAQRMYQNSSLTEHVIREEASILQYSRESVGEVAQFSMEQHRDHGVPLVKIDDAISAAVSTDEWTFEPVQVRGPVDISHHIGYRPQSFANDACKEPQQQIQEDDFPL